MIFELNIFLSREGSKVGWQFLLSRRGEKAKTDEEGEEEEEE